MQTKVYKFGGKRVEKLPYLFFAPAEIETGKTYPLIVFLHGAGERGSDNPDLITCYAIPKLLKQGKEIPAFVIAPQCPEGMVWNGLTEEVKELIDATVAENPVDPDRISVTGLSMGGYGTWEMGISYPGFFSALAPVCGGGISWRVAGIGKTPVWAFHGEQDTVVPPRNSIEMCDRLKAAGGNVELTLWHFANHNSWDASYERTNLIDWLIEQHR